jgi:hypothetical protein
MPVEKDFAWISFFFSSFMIVLRVAYVLPMDSILYMHVPISFSPFRNTDLPLGF